MDFFTAIPMPSWKAQGNYAPFGFVKKITSSILIFLFLFISHSTLSGQVVINEFIADPGMYDGQGAEWTELYNPGTTAADVSCYLLTDGEEIIVIPDGTMIPAGGYLVIYNSNFFACANCNWDASVITNTVGTSTSPAAGVLNAGGASGTTSWLDVASCACTNQNAPYSITWDNGGGDGDRIVLFDGNANVADAVYSGDGSGGSQNLGPGVLPENSSGYTDAQAGGNVDDGNDIIGNSTFGCTLPAANDYSLPALADMEFVGPDRVGCTTSYSRTADGGASWFTDNWPTPGQDNTIPDFLLEYSIDNGDTYQELPSSGLLDICGSTDIQFRTTIYAYNSVYEDDNGDDVAGDGTNFEGGSPRGGSNIDVDGDFSGGDMGGTNDSWMESGYSSTTVNGIPTGQTILISATYNVTAFTEFDLFIKENTQASTASNIPDKKVVSIIFGSGTGSECYILEKLELDVIDPISSATFTCDNGLSTVTVDPETFGVTYELLDQAAFSATGGNVVASNTTGQFLVTTDPTDTYFIRVVQEPACGGPLQATGMVCVFAPPCPDFIAYESCTTPEGPLCPDDDIILGLSASDLPEGSSIEWVLLPLGDNDPYDNPISDVVATSVSSFSNTTHYTLDFDGSGSYSTDVTEEASAPYHFGSGINITIPAAFIPSNAEGNFFSINDIDRSDGTNGGTPSSTQNIDIGPIDLSSVSALSCSYTLSVDLASFGDGAIDASDGFEFQWSTDNISFTSIESAEGTMTNGSPVFGTNPIGETFSTFTSTFRPTSGASNLYIRIIAKSNSANEHMAFDNLIISSSCLELPCVDFSVSTSDCNSTLRFAPRISPDQTGCNTTSGGPDAIPMLPIREYTITCPTATISGETAICGGTSTSVTVDLGNFSDCTIAEVIIYNENGDEFTNATTTIIGNQITISNIDEAGIFMIDYVELTGCSGDVCMVDVSGDVTISLSDNPAVPAGIQADVCWDGTGPVSIGSTLSSGNNTVWYTDMALSQVSEIAMGVPLLYTPTATGAQTLYVTQRDPDTGCESAGLAVSFTVNADPIANPTTLTVCEDETGDSQGDFTLTAAEDASSSENTGNVDVDNGATGVTITYHSSQLDATLDQNPLPNGNNLVAGTIYARIDDSNGCFDTAPITLVVVLAPDAGTNGMATACDDSSEGTSTVDLDDQLMGTPDATGTWMASAANPASTTIGAGNVVDFNSLAQGSYVFTYTVTGNSPCMDATATVTVTVESCLTEMCSPPTISTQPMNITLCSANASNHDFSVTAANNASTGSTLNYQWEFSSDGGMTWMNVMTSMNGTTSTVTVQGGEFISGYQFRVIITDPVNATNCVTTSNAATLTIDQVGIDCEDFPWNGGNEEEEEEEVIDGSTKKKSN